MGEKFNKSTLIVLCLVVALGCVFALYVHHDTENMKKVIEKTNSRTNQLNARLSKIEAKFK